MHINRVRAAAIAGTTTLALGALLALAPPAGATIDHTTGGMTCTGSATITPKNGAPYTINATQSEAHVPREAGPVQYQGGTSPISHNHSGAVKVDLGFVGITVYSWASKNDGDKPDDGGVAKYPKAMKDAPPGKYYVTGFHKAKEGGCSGHMTIIIDGDTLSSTAADAALLATLIAALLLLLSGLSKKAVG